MSQHKLLSSRDVDPMCRDENDSTLLHKAAAYGQLSVIQLLLKELPSSMLQHVDNFFLTPAMLAIQVCPEYIIVCVIVLQLFSYMVVY